MGWLRLSLNLDSARVEQAEQLLESCGSLSVTVTDAGAQPLLEPLPGATPLWQACHLEALFDADLAIDPLREQLVDAGFEEFTLDVLDDADWQNRWRQYAVDFCFAGRLWLVPKEGTPQGEPALRLDPGLAFGSGSHPTTRLCLDWLARQDLSGRTVLDFGCGSGILGLAALKLGAGRVTAIDHDPQALLATRQNAAYNALADEALEVGLPGDLGPGRFELVLANILANPLIELAEVLSAALEAGGTLVMSGMLESQTDEVLAAYPDLTFEPPRVEADEQGARWVCLIGRAR